MESGKISKRVKKLEDQVAHIQIQLDAMSITKKEENMKSPNPVRQRKVVRIQPVPEVIEISRPSRPGGTCSICQTRVSDLDQHMKSNHASDLMPRRLRRDRNE